MARLEFDIVGNNASGIRALNQVDSAAGRADQGIRRLGDDSTKAQGGIRGLGAAAGTAVKSFGPLAAAAAGGAVLKFGLDSIKAASDTQQAFGAIESVFGKNAATVKGWANNAVSSVGLARSEYGNLAVTLGSMLKNTGIEDYSAKTDQLIKLGADLSATYGGSVNDAVAAVGSLLRGETDPIEAYGVAIKQSDVTARLAADGLGKLTGKALAQAEQQTRLKLLFEQTKSAQGAFGRETDTLAGQQQRLTARFTNLKDTLGTKLLPVATRVVTWLSNTVSGSNKTAGAIQKLGTIASTYGTPVFNAWRNAVQTSTTALNNATGKSGSAGSSIKKLGEVAVPVAKFLGTNMARSITTAASATAALITGAARVAGAIKGIVGAVSSAIGALDRLREKASINIPNPLGGLTGIFRSQSGLARAGGYGLLGGVAAAPRVSFTSAPRIVVNVDHRALRGFVVATIDDRLTDVFGAVQAGVSD